MTTDAIKNAGIPAAVNLTDNTEFDKLVTHGEIPKTAQVLLLDSENPDPASVMAIPE